MGCTPELIRSRFVEAAHTERFLPPDRGPRAKGYWPEYFYDEEDKAGWDDQARLDNAERRVLGRATSAAISRHEECLSWTSTFIDEGRPLTVMMTKVLWMWSFCKANDRDFGSRCNRLGWARPTAYRRLNAIAEAFCEKFDMEGFVVRLPDEKWLRHEEPSMASSSGTVVTHGHASAIKFTPAFRTEKSTDLLTTDDAVADFVKHRDQVNAERRRFQEREAKRRAKIGAAAS